MHNGRGQETTTLQEAEETASNKKASFVGGESCEPETVSNGRPKRRRKARFLYVYVSAEPVDLVGQSV